jgi:hypothetical protein
MPRSSAAATPTVREEVGDDKRVPRLSEGLSSARGETVLTSGTPATASKRQLADLARAPAETAIRSHLSARVHQAGSRRVKLGIGPNWRQRPR